MVMASTLWAFWWEDDTPVPFVPPFLSRFVWRNDTDPNNIVFESFLWSTSSDLFGWR